MRRGKLRTNNPRLQTSLPFNLKSSYLIFLLSNVLTILLAAFKILCDKACVIKPVIKPIKLYQLRGARTRTYCSFYCVDVILRVL